MEVAYTLKTVFELIRMFTKLLYFIQKLAHPTIEGEAISPYLLKQLPCIVVLSNLRQQINSCELIHTRKWDN